MLSFALALAKFSVVEISAEWLLSRFIVMVRRLDDRARAIAVLVVERVVIVHILVVRGVIGTWPHARSHHMVVDARMHDQW